MRTEKTALILLGLKRKESPRREIGTRQGSLLGCLRPLRERQRENAAGVRMVSLFPLGAFVRRRKRNRGAPQKVRAACARLLLRAAPVAGCITLGSLAIAPGLRRSVVVSAFPFVWPAGLCSVLVLYAVHAAGGRALDRIGPHLRPRKANKARDLSFGGDGD
jgi:hypothetical protein